MIVEGLGGLWLHQVDRHKATVLQTHKDFVNKCDLRDNGLFQEVITKFNDIHHTRVADAKLNIYLAGLLCYLLLRIILTLLHRSFVML